MQGDSLKQLLPDVQEMMSAYKYVIANNYFNKTPVLTYENVEVNKDIVIPRIDFNLDDIVATCALIGTPVSLIGSKGGGKSYLADIMAHCLFGDNFAEKTINPSLGINDFADPSFRDMKDSKTKSDYLKPDKILTKPCLVINEVNRAHPSLQNFFIGLLENKMNIFSLNFKAGEKTPYGNFYFFPIITMNEGIQYSGASNVDTALRDRMGIEVFMDNFSYYEGCTDDHLKLVKSKLNPEIIHSQSGFTDLIYVINKDINSIKIDTDSTLFTLFLSWMDKCTKSKVKSKTAVSTRSLMNLCQGCESSKDHNSMCMNVFKPSNRAFTDISKFAKAVSFMKAVKIYDYCSEKDISFDNLHYEIEVTLEDMIVASPFILAGKTEMNSKWLNEYYQGNKMIAAQEIADNIKKEIVESREILDICTSKNPEHTVKVQMFNKKRFGPDIIDFFKKYMLKNE